MIKPGRLPCLVPWCRRTGKRNPGDDANVELICGKHWRLTDRSARRRFTRLERLLKRGIEGEVRTRVDRLYLLQWDRIKDQAITRAMGA